MDDTRIIEDVYAEKRKKAIEYLGENWLLHPKYKVNKKHSVYTEETKELTVKQTKSYSTESLKEIIMENNTALLKTNLQEGVVEVKFTKRNGDIRVMKCTLNFALIPTEHQPSTSGTSKDDSKNTSLPVFDIDNQEWRSFIFDKVIEWKKC